MENQDNLDIKESETFKRRYKIVTETVGPKDTRKIWTMAQQKYDPFGVDDKDIIVDKSENYDKEEKLMKQYIENKMKDKEKGENSESEFVKLNFILLSLS